MKVVLATSPGMDQNGNYLIYSPSRWCEGVENESSWFAYYPWELGYLSSLLKQETKHKVKLLDGCLEKLDKFQYYKRILNEKPDWLIFESSTKTIEENLWIANKIKNRLNTTLVFVGHHSSVYSEHLRKKGIDCIIKGEYEFSILNLLNNKNPSSVKGIYPSNKNELVDINKLPFPEDKDVSRIDYSTPGEPCAEYKEIEMFASRGCPFDCSFCVARHVYYGCKNWRGRNVDNIISEIMYLRNKYPEMEGIFFNEELHNGKKEFILNLSDEIISNNLDKLKYEAMCDLRLLDREVIKVMKKAGYYKVRIGIESVSERVLNKINKNLNRKDIIKKLNLCKKEGIKTYGTFMFGAPGSSLVEDKKNINFISKLIKRDLLDDVQISICTPQPGTPFYNWSVRKNLLNCNSFSDFDGGLKSVIDYPHYSNEEIQYMKNLALKVRDREIFKRKFKKDKLLTWINEIKRKYGVGKLFLKGLRRLKSELLFSIRKLFGLY